MEGFDDPENLDGMRRLDATASGVEQRPRTDRRRTDRRQGTPDRRRPENDRRRSLYAVPSTGPVGVLCPRCRAVLSDDWSASHLTCTGCAYHIPVMNGIPRFVADSGYADTFAQTAELVPVSGDADGERSDAELFSRHFGLVREQVAGKLVLDAGCGTGIYTNIMAGWGAQVTGLDLSEAIDVAPGRLGQRPNVRLVQADLFDMPFPEYSFDIVMGIGVIHHTPDPWSAFRSLARMVKPGGMLLLWAPGTSAGVGGAAGLYRRISVHLPFSMLRLICQLARPFFFLNQVPGVRAFSQLVFPAGAMPPIPRGLVDTLDWYTAVYQNLHSYPEIYDWFRVEGFQEIRLHVPGVSVSALRAR